MSVILAELENIQGVGRASKTPKYVIKGTRRRILKKAYEQLQLLVAQDNREALRAERYGYTPLFATGEPGSDDWKNVLACIQRLALVIQAKA